MIGRTKAPAEREAHRLYQREWRARNRERCRGYHRAYAERNRSARRLADTRSRIRGQRILNKLKDRPCARLVEEASKRDVVCANCHRERTYHRRTPVAL